MSLKNIISVTVLLLATVSLSAQTSDSEQQYKAAMQNAKTAFDAKMYSEALYFYREALSIKPDAKLPRYKIEDIRTIYIDDGIKEIAGNKPTTDNAAVQKQAETKADERIEAEVKQASTEMEKLKIATILDISDDMPDYDENIDIEDIEPTIETEIKEDPVTEEPTIAEPKTEEPKIETHITEEQITETPKETPKPAETTPTVASKPAQKPVIKPVQPAKTITDEEKEARKEAEKQKLRTQYPEEKTVLEYDQPGKHITRVIIHVDNEISIFLKVKHSWGATFFFEEEIGEGLKSINEIYFNKMTNLANYGH